MKRIASKNMRIRNINATYFIKEYQKRKMLIKKREREREIERENGRT